MATLLFSGWLSIGLGTIFAQSIPIEWVRQIGSTSADNIGRRMAVDSFGNCFVTGTYGPGSAGFGTTNLSPIGGADIFLAKYDSAGNLLWARAAGGMSGDTGDGVALDANGNVILTGTIRGTAQFGTNTVAAVNNGIDMFLASYNSNGALNWVRTYGGAGAERPESITVDAEGVIYVAGSFSGATSIGDTALANPGSLPDIFLAKFDPSGSPLWARRAGGATGQDYTDFASSVGIDGSGSIYIAGSFASPRSVFGPFTLTNHTSGGTGFLAKYGHSGDVIWARKLTTSPNSPADERSSAADIAVDTDGNIHVCGQYIYDVFIDGFGLTNATQGRDNVFVARFSSNGETLWALGGGGTDFDLAPSIAVDSAANSYVAGAYWGPWTLGQRTLPPVGSAFAMCVFKIDANGNVQWAYGAGSASGDAIGRAIVAAPNGDTYVGGTFNANVSFGATNLTESSAGDVFLFRGPRSPPRIVLQPQGQNVTVGDTVGFSVVAEGGQPLIYQWLFNGTYILGANGPDLTLTNTTHAQAGFYSVIVSNLAGVVTSDVVQLLFNFLTLNMYAGLTIDGAPGQTFQVQYVAALDEQANWQALTNVTLTNVPYLFIDVHSPNAPRRFYRAIPWP